MWILVGIAIYLIIACLIGGVFYEIGARNDKPSTDAEIFFTAAYWPLLFVVAFFIGLVQLGRKIGKILLKSNFLMGRKA